MKTIALMFFSVALLLAQDQKTAPAKTNPPPKAASLPAIPAGAKEVEPNLYRYTDPQGTAWLYRRTPFGISKWEDKPATPAAAVDGAVQTKVTDLGDSVRFERQTPFGVGKWVRKKSELTEDERALLDREQARQQPVDHATEKP
jgi:hypothetical protein